MATARTLKIQEADLLRLAVEMLHQAFHAGTRLDAKRRYRALEEGRRLLLTEMPDQDGQNPIRITLGLDRRELRGSLNFTLLRDLTGQLVVRALTALRENGPLHSFSDDGGRTLFLLPAVGGHGANINVLVIGIDGRRAEEIGIELTFLDSDQFRQEQAANG